MEAWFCYIKLQTQYNIHKNGLYPKASAKIHYRNANDVYYTEITTYVTKCTL